MASFDVAMPHLDDRVLSEILYRLPSEDAYHLATVCRQWRAVLSQPTFLCRHLSPRPLPLLDDRPYAIIIQPRRKAGFTHLTLVAIDPADRVPVSVPIQPKYMDSAPPPTVTEPSREDAATVDPTTAMVDVFTPADATPVPLPPSEDYVVFFERTVPMLNISIVASHGRMLLCRSRGRYYVCDPTANRWLALPPSTVAPSSAPSYGLHYDVDASTGRLALTVVLLVRRRRRRVLVDTFSSATGRWDARELSAPGAARYLPAVSPGIYVGTCFYWLSRRWQRGRCRYVNRILRYDAARCGASLALLREPPLAEGAKGRGSRSLGSVAGGLRLCAFDNRKENESMMPHGDDSDDEMEGVHGVWLMDAPSSAWRRVHESTVDDVSAYWFNMLFGDEMPMDFAGACGEFIVVVKWARLLRFDLESGSKVELASLKVGNPRIDTLYQRCNACVPFLQVKKSLRSSFLCMSSEFGVPRNHRF